MRFFNKNKKDKYDATDDVLRRVDGKRIRYVAERDYETYGENILGHDGILVATENEIAVMCDGCDVFVCQREGARVSELMSLGGVVISGMCNDGTEKTVTAYFTYYRK